MAVPFEGALEAGFALVAGEEAVDAGGGKAFLAKGLDLVFHQGDQGADHKGEAIENEGGELVTEGFSLSGCHEDEAVFSPEAAEDGGLLNAAEVLEAEVGLEGLFGLFEHEGSIAGRFAGSLLGSDVFSRESFGCEELRSGGIAIRGVPRGFGPRGLWIDLLLELLSGVK